MIQLTAPNRVDVVWQVSLDEPVAFSNCHRPELGTDRATAFVRYVAAELHRSDPNFGLNGKRGTGELSMDAVSYLNPLGPGGVEIIDIVGGAGGPDPEPQWLDVTQDTINGGTVGRWIDPRGREPGEPKPPTPAPPPTLPESDEILDHVLDDYAFWLPRAPHREAAIGDWYRAVYQRSASLADLQHALWRCTTELSRWQHPSGRAATLREILEVTWPSSETRRDELIDRVLRRGRRRRIWSGRSM